MANLAIKGHATRGKEVIEILEMLEGKNETHIKATVLNAFYYINEDGKMYLADKYSDMSNFVIYTLEEFLEKYPYKIGDKVSSKYLKNYEVSKMEWESVNNRVIYKLQGMGWYSADELQPYKEETMEEKGILTIDFTKDTRIADEVEVILGDYEFVLKDGKTYFVKKKPKYPKTYEECCKVLQMPKDESYIDIDAPLSYNKVLTSFTQLLICRDAYWKIAGNWEPNFANQEEKFIIACYYGKMYTTMATNYNRILVFPTEEMRDAFYENFNELIEECKELL